MCAVVSLVLPLALGRPVHAQQPATPPAGGEPTPEPANADGNAPAPDADSANSSDSSDEVSAGDGLDDEALDLEGAEVIIVTSQKREERLVDVPLAVTALSGSAVEDSASNTVESLPRLIPTLTFRKGTTTRNSALFLRGVGTISFSIAAEPSVSTVVDGVVYSRSGQAFSDLYDIERIEVLRGPQGTLFGKNASAGVLNMISRRPKNTFEADITMAAFGDSEYRTSATMSGPIGKDVRGRFTGFYGYMDGYVDNVHLGEMVNGYQRQGGRGLLEWTPSFSPRPLLITVIGDYGRGEDDCCAELLSLPDEPGESVNVVLDQIGRDTGALGPDQLIVSQNLRSQTRDESAGLSVQANLEIGKHALTSITAYRGWSNTEIRDGDFLSGGASHVGVFELHDTGVQSFGQFSQELRLTSPAGRRFEYQAGLFLFLLNSNRTFTRQDITCADSQLAPDATGLAPCEPGQATIAFPTATAIMSSDFDNYAAFGQGLVRLTDKLRFTGGLRLTRDTVGFQHRRFNPTGEAGPGVRDADFPGPDGEFYTDSTSALGVSGRAVLQFDLKPDINIFSSYARGYKGPAYNVFFNFSENNSLPIDPETSNAVELGIKGALPGARLYFSATGFYQQFDNFQANNFIDLDGTIITTLTNAGTVSTKGVELELSAQPVTGLRLSGGLAYVDAQIDEFNVVDGAPDADTRVGEELPLSPDWKLSVGGDYRLPLGGSPVSVTLGTQYAWQSEQYSNLGANPDLLIAGYGMWDARITLASKNERISLALIGRNLLDQHFSTLITPGGPAGTFRHQVPRDAHRFFGASLRGRL